MSTASQLDNHAPIGSLLKRPGNTRHKREKLGRSPRVQEPSHLQAIRTLPCIKCGVEDFSEAAHVRMNSAAFNKRVGKGEKPSDCWSLSLCAACHRIDPDSQHRVGEETFWHALGLNPLLICEALHKASPDIVRMRAVVFSFIAQRIKG
jgi:hypothetical protein